MSSSASSGWLLDTCLLSELRKQKINPGVAQWLNGVDLSLAFVSISTIAELEMGVAKLHVQNSILTSNYEKWIADVKRQFAKTILGTDDEVWRVWAELMGAGLAQGQPRTAIATLLVATAQLHHLTIVTRSVRDFAPCPLIHDPWAETA